MVGVENMPYSTCMSSIYKCKNVSGREEARAVQEIQPRSTLCRYVSGDGIAATRSYVSILDTMIVNFFIVLYYGNFPICEQFTHEIILTRKFPNLRYVNNVYNGVVY